MSIMMVLRKVHQLVIPAQAGIHNILKSLDSRLRGNDKIISILSFCGAVNYHFSVECV